jgi:hypothetical protein
MKNITIIFITAFMAFLSLAVETTNVTVVIDGKRVEFSADIRSQIVQRSVDLLASCGYMNAKPNWGASNESNAMAPAQKSRICIWCFPALGKSRSP